MTDDPIFPERRKRVRHRAMKPATVVLDGGRTKISCLVRDQSDSGARLKIDAALEMPDSFLLQIGHDEPRVCHIVWKADHQLGVAFV